MSENENSGKIRCAHLFLIPEASPETHHATIETSMVRIEIFGVSSHAEGEKLSKSLVSSGILMIELCGSWGYEGASRIVKAVGGRIPVGVVMHQQHNCFGLATVMGKSKNPYNRL
ncbi:MAG: hypothetical protein HXS43_11920 [Theionarchaea archaeon]|nr:hypothetical protein [Theionarchaea archaeon]